MIQRLITEIQRKNAPVVIGLDPQMKFIPEGLIKSAIAEHGETLDAAAAAFFEFNKNIIDAVADIVPAVKPQIAMYEQYGLPGIGAFIKTTEYAKEKGLIVIGDIKRGDIGSTSASYASGHIGTAVIGEKTVTPFGEDFVTVNPYLGSDGVMPFIDACNENDKGIFVLVKTSNPSSGEFQDKLIDETPLYELVGSKVDEWGSLSMDGSYSNVGAVVGATYPEMGARLRKIMPKAYILVPGYGAQGGTAEGLRPFFNPDGLGAIVNSSRGIIAAYTLDKYKDQGFKPEDYAAASRQAAIDMVEDITSAIR